MPESDPVKADDPADADSNPKLSAAELQEFRELLARGRSQPGAPVLPELELDDAVRDRFADSLFGGDPFTVTFTAFGGKFTATFRSRRKWEIDLCTAQFGIDYREGLFTTDQSLSDARKVYALRFQLTRLNGAEQDTVYPRKDPNMTLRKWTADSPLEDMDETRLVILCNWLAQFDALTARLQLEAADPVNFTPPGAGA